MKEIIKSSLLEYEKSAFVIDLVKHTNGKLYLEINQTISDEQVTANRTIKLNPSIIADIIAVLTSYHALISSSQTIVQGKGQKSYKVQSKSLSESEKSEIRRRYLKGVSIPDLSMQFDCAAALIEQILRNAEISIIDNKPPSPKYYRRSKCKSRSS